MAGLLAAWVMALARTLPVFVAGMLFYGFTAFVSAPMNSYITSARGKLSLVRAMTLVSAAYNFGAVLGPISGGWIAHRYGLERIYLISACIFIVSTAILFFLRKQAREIHDPSAPPTSLWQNKRLVSFLGIIFLAMFVMYLPQPLTPRFLQNERGSVLGNHRPARFGRQPGEQPGGAGGGTTRSSKRIPAGASLGGNFFPAFVEGNGLAMVYARVFPARGDSSRPGRCIMPLIRPLIHPAQIGLAYGVAETFGALGVMLAPLLAGLLYTKDPAAGVPGEHRIVGVMVVVSAFFAPRLATHGEQMT